jgi:hypothetical protein
MDHGDQFAREALTKNPAKFITLINACSNMACADIAIRESRWRAEDSGAQAPALRPVLRSLGERGSSGVGGSACSNSVQPPSITPTAASQPVTRSSAEGGPVLRSSAEGGPVLRSSSEGGPPRSNSVQPLASATQPAGCQPSVPTPGGGGTSRTATSETQNQNP